ncbi:unnamed protein product, partial [Rotaria sp. Silwood1]
MRTLILGRTVYIHTDHCPICGMLRKPVNNRRIERVANLIQEYQIAEIKHVDGKSNCLADYLSRTLADPLFDIPYGLESKLTAANASTSSSFHQLDQISAMTLRPRPKQIQISTPVVPDLGSPSSDAVSICSSEASTLVSSPFTTAPSPNSFDVSALPHEQQRDPDLHRIFQQLTDRTASSSLTSSFIIKNNILHKLISRTPTSTRKLAVPYLPSSMVKSLLIATHDDPYQGGHFSVDKMFSKLRLRYWWPRMRHTIQQHVRACIPCQQYNISRQRPPGHLHPVPPTAVPFSIIGMDYCGPFVTSSNDNKYVLVVTDLFTRFVTAIALPSNTAAITALTLFRYIFCKYGVCSTLITDQGT